MNEISRLQEEIAELESTNEYPHTPSSYMLWDMLMETGVLPFAGGYLDQPDWFDKDVAYFSKKQRLIDIEIAVEHLEQSMHADKQDEYRENSTDEDYP